MGRLFDVPDEPPARPAEPPAADLPLAARMRPRTLEEFVGQTHLLGQQSALRTAIQSGEPHSMILYGPPGTGKTTLARMLAEYADAAFEELSAVEAGRAEVREVIARARERRRGGRHTIFFLDEIHRFNKAQQDALLPAVEEGLVVLVGATTENPYFEVNSALISRTQVYELQELTPEDIGGLLRRALDEVGRTVSDEVIEFLAARSGGDARSSLNALELALDTAARTGAGGHAGRRRGRDAAQGAALRQGRRPALRLHLGLDQVHARVGPGRVAVLPGGDARGRRGRALHRAPDGDPGLRGRRQRGPAGAAGRGRRGPRRRARRAARGDLRARPGRDLPRRWRRSPTPRAARSAPPGAHIREHGAAAPPAALRSAAYPAARKLGRGIGYDYPHDHPGQVNDQEHLPAGAEHLRFYDPGDMEPELRERLARIRAARGRDA